MIRRPPRSTQSRSSAASDVYKRQSAFHALRSWMFVIARASLQHLAKCTAVPESVSATQLLPGEARCRTWVLASSQVPYTAGRPSGLPAPLRGGPSRPEEVEFEGVRMHAHPAC